MDDFTIRVKNLPKDHMFGGNSEYLKAYLIKHFETIISDELIKEQGNLDVDNTNRLKQLSICDINFGEASMKKTEYLNALSTIRN